MSQPDRPESNDALFCWEQLARTHRLFRISRLFTSRDEAARLLPLYALFSSIEQVISDISDESVARNQLAWWHEECVGRVAGESNHPVLKELQRSGAADSLRSQDMASLLGSAWSRLDPHPPPDFDALKKLCVEIGEPQLNAELRICAAGPLESGVAEGLAAQTGLFQLIREGERGWIPLNTLARHGISRDDVLNLPESQAVNNVFQDLAEAASEWAEPALSVLESQNPVEPPRHLMVINALYARKLKLLPGFKAASQAVEMNRPSAMDVWTAWRMARRLNHQ